MAGGWHPDWTRTSAGTIHEGTFSALAVGSRYTALRTAVND
jgi:hypothetical protein